MNKYLRIVNKLMDDIAVLHPQENEKLCGDGAVYYMNGNDSTRFDWTCNSRLCEFMKFYKSSEMGYIKVLCYRDGSMEAMLYTEDGDYKYKPYAKKLVYNALTESGMQHFYQKMMNAADKKDLWDKNVNELAW